MFVALKVRFQTVIAFENRLQIQLCFLGVIVEIQELKALIKETMREV